MNTLPFVSNFIDQTLPRDMLHEIQREQCNSNYLHYVFRILEFEFLQ